MKDTICQPTVGFPLSRKEHIWIRYAGSFMRTLSELYCQVSCTQRVVLINTLRNGDAGKEDTCFYAIRHDMLQLAQVRID
jgi:hypothetical protein